MGSIAIVLALLSVAFMANSQELDLDGESFADAVKANDHMLVMFFAPWCGHCKSLKPKWAEAAKKAAAASKPYKLAKVDCTLETAKGLCEHYKVKGYPTVMYFKKGVPTEYSGPRETDGILTWLDKKSGPTVTTLKSAEAAAEFLKTNENAFALVGYFASEGTDAQKSFLAEAEDANLEEFKVAQVIGTVAGHADGEVTLHLQGGEKSVRYTGEPEKLAEWAFESHFPLLDEVGGHNFAKYAKRGKPLHLVFIDPSDANRDQILADLRTVAAEHTDESFSHIDAVKYKAQIKGMGASGNVVPVIVRIAGFDSSAKPVVFEQPLTLASLRDFATGAKSGKYVYVPKSEPIPADNSGPVKTLVGKNFDAIVNDPTKNVVVEFYAPWCGHCKTLAPKYEELGKLFENSKDVVIAKIDQTANDVESHYQIKGFPTILFYSATDKTNPIAYEGAREVEAMSKFINKLVSGASDEDDEDDDEKDEL